MTAEPDWARAVALARRERGVRGGRRGLVFTALLVAGLHAAAGFASLGAASDVPVARTREVDVMRSMACLALLIGSSSFATETNLVVGGDFESVAQGAQGASCHSTLLPEVSGWNSNLGWQVDRFQNTGCVAGCIPLHAGGGQYSISLQGSVCCGCNNNGFIEQTVQTVAGARYRLTFDTVLDDSDALRVSLNGDDTVHMWNGELQWRSISREFVATGPTVLRFASEAPPTSTNTSCGGCWEGEGCMLDNIRLVQIPIEVNLVAAGDFEAAPQGKQGTACHSTLLPEVPGWNSNLGWQVDRFQNTGCVAGCIPLHAGGGQYSISLQGSVCCGCNNNGFIEQTVQTVAGARYRLTFDTVLDDSDVLRVSLSGADTSHAWNGQLQWRSISREFVATGPTVLRFASEAPPTSTNTSCGGCWEGEGCMLDNIRLVQILTCPADVIQNGVIDGADLAALLTVWGTDGGIYPRADTNADGVVDANDLAVVLGGWGACP